MCSPLLVPRREGTRTSARLSLERGESGDEKHVFLHLYLQIGRKREP